LNAPTAPFEPTGAHRRLARLVGTWVGTARTVFEPGAAGVEAPWEATAASLLGGRFLRFTYRSELNGQPLAGELLVAFETGEKLWRTAWVDSFHTGTALMASEGPAADGPIRVTGRYFAAEGHPHWGWRTELHDDRPETLTLRMFNITPDGQEDLGVEVLLARQV
jgi:hypothetical protein